MRTVAAAFIVLLASSTPLWAVDVLVSIDKTEQKMTVFTDGVQTYEWPVSTGSKGYDTPSGEYTATSMNKVWYSKQYDNAPMPHSIFFMKDGHAIHGTTEVKNLGKAASHGCVRLAPENAKKLFEMVSLYGLENTQVVLTGEVTSYIPAAPPPGQQRASNKRKRYAPPGYYPRYWRDGPGGYYPPGYRYEPRRRWLRRWRD